MPREIKFRARDSYDYDMVSDICNARQDTWYETLNEFFRDDRWEFMQFTWLVDKNGKEIYEGDVIEKLFYGKDRTVIIERDKDYWGFNISYRLQEWIINTDTREVIGNIYENPELIEQ